jgi:exopolyphosphatase/guanosine-5'-triphosphate,3'-diphosphate pyrophosphatase
VQALATRYHVDSLHVAHIRQTLLPLLQGYTDQTPSDLENNHQWLEWAASLHEIGLDIAHSQYHKHSAYIIKNADLPGFSHQDQILLATLVRAHRRKFLQKLFKNLPPPWDGMAKNLAVILRLAILLNRSRHDRFLPEFQAHFDGSRFSLIFPQHWLEQHPLTIADLEQEAQYLLDAGITLTFE